MGDTVLMSRKKTRFNFPCNCSAYDFPHRLGGGKCSGDEWAEFYFYNMRSECSGCNCLRESDGVCEVAVGQESITECEAAADMEHYGHTLIPCVIEELYC